MTQLLECRTCRLQFSYSKQHKKYCSKSCSKLGQVENQRLWYRKKHPRPQKQCRICESVIPETSSKKNLCSQRCKDLAEQIRSKARQIRDKDKIRIQGRQWWQNNKEKHRETNRLSARKRRSKPGVMKREMARYRARKKKVQVYLFTARDENRLLNRQAYRCAYCQQPLTSNNRQIDHVIPLSKGGPHGPSNLVFACEGCNSSKNDLFVSEWRLRQQKLIEKLKP